MQGGLVTRLGVQRGEARTTLLLAGVFFFTSTGSALGSNAIDALLFARFGVQFLPILDIALGVLTVGATIVITAVLGGGARERFYVALAAGLGLALIAFRLALVTGLRDVIPVLWLAMNVGNSCQGILTWGLAGAAVDARQAKRLFPLFAAGGILGSVAGGLLTRPLAGWLHSENLVLAWALALGFAFVCGLVLLRSGGPATPPRHASFLAESRQGLLTVRRSPMLRWLALAVVLFAFLYAGLQFPFARAAAAAYPNPDALAGFLGVFQAAATGIAFVASLLVAGRLYARIGLANSVLVFSLIYLAVFGALALQGGFWVLVAGRFLNIAYLFGVAGSAYHALFNVVPGERRDQARAFLDGVPAQFGTALAGALLILVQARPPIVLYSIGIAAAALLVAALWQVRRDYGSALIDAVRAGRPVIFGAPPALSAAGQDQAAMEAIERSLEAEDRQDEALLRLERLDALPPGLRDYAEARRDRALRYHRLWLRLPEVNAGERLLAASVRIRAERDATRAIRAAALLGGRGLSIAVDGLSGRDSGLRAMSLEALEALGEPAIVGRLLEVFEPPASRRPDTEAISELAGDADAWLRDCARFAAGVELGPVQTGATVPLMERVQMLSAVPLFRDIDPADLRLVAEVASEQVFRDGQEVVHQGDPGDELYVIIEGELVVTVDGQEVARRRTGDHVGEMAVLTRQPRMASVAAAGEVRVLCLSQAQFEAMLRERPEIGLAVIGALCERLRERSPARA